MFFHVLSCSFMFFHVLSCSFYILQCSVEPRRHGGNHQIRNATARSWNLHIKTCSSFNDLIEAKAKKTKSIDHYWPCHICNTYVIDMHCIHLFPPISTADPGLAFLIPVQTGLSLGGWEHPVFLDDMNNIYILYMYIYIYIHIYIYTYIYIYICIYRNSDSTMCGTAAGPFALTFAASNSSKNWLSQWGQGPLKRGMDRTNIWP